MSQHDLGLFGTEFLLGLPAVDFACRIGHRHQRAGVAVFIGTSIRLVGRQAGSDGDFIYFIITFIHRTRPVFIESVDTACQNLLRAAFDGIRRLAVTVARHQRSARNCHRSGGFDLYRRTGIRSDSTAVGIQPPVTVGTVLPDQAPSAFYLYGGRSSRTAIAAFQPVITHQFDVRRGIYFECRFIGCGLHTDAAQAQVGCFAARSNQQSVVFAAVTVDAPVDADALGGAGAGERRDVAFRSVGHVGTPRCGRRNRDCPAADIQQRRSGYRIGMVGRHRERYLGKLFGSSGQYV